MGGLTSDDIAAIRERVRVEEQERSRQADRRVVFEVFLFPLFALCFVVLVLYVGGAFK